jgi:glycine/D-amino acid oxidase-like deaminating enzyme
MQKLDVLIVGQGLAGSLLAFELEKSNISFDIISDPNKNKASAVAAGMINPLVFRRLTKSYMIDDLWPVLEESYGQIERTLNEKFLFKKDILKPLSIQEKQLWLDRKNETGFSTYIRDVVVMPGIEHIAEAPGYGIVSGAGYLKAKQFLVKAAQYFRKKGYLIENAFSFDKFNPDAPLGIKNTIYKSIVFCEGHFAKQNPFFQFVKLEPTKGEVLQLHIPGLSEKYILNKKVFLLPVGKKRFKAGSTFQWDNLDEIPTEEGKLSIIERVEQLISTPFNVEHQWAGIRPTVVDRRPVLGQHPAYKNLYIFNGLGTKGVMLAPHFAREMLKLITLPAYKLPKEVDVRRFL